MFNFYQDNILNNIDCVDDYICVNVRITYDAPMIRNPDPLVNYTTVVWLVMIKYSLNYNYLTI